jgi:hypothetical protein
MKQKYLWLLILICCSLYFVACSSESYNIDNANSTDTSSLKTPVNVNSAEVEKILKSKRTYTVKSAPTFVLSLTGNYNIGVSELSLNDNPAQFIAGQNFGVRNGYGFNAMGKIPIDKQKGNIRIIVLGSFNHFKDNFSNASYTDSGSVQYSIFSGGVGIENNFTPKFSVKPFIGIAILGSMISGKSDYIFNGVSNSVNIKSSFRLGYTVYAGLEYVVSNSIGINLGGRITSVNTWLKKSVDDGGTTDVSLRDAFTSPPIPYGGWKNFAFTSFYLGTSIYFGVKDKIFKF